MTINKGEIFQNYQKKLNLKMKKIRRFSLNFINGNMSLMQKLKKWKLFWDSRIKKIMSKIILLVKFNLNYQEVSNLKKIAEYDL